MERGVCVKSLKRAAAAALAAGLILCAAVGSAEIRSWREDITVVTGTNLYTAFDGELPADMKKAFPKSKWNGYACVSGIMCQREGDEWRRALVVMEKDDETCLVGLTGLDGGSWQIVAANPRAMLQGRKFALAGSDRSQMAVVYPCEDGGEERFSFSVQQLSDGIGGRFMMEAYVRSYPDGRKVSVSGGSQGAGFFEVTTAAADGEERIDKLPCITSTFLEDFDAEAFPKTLSEVRSYQEAAPKFLQQDKIAAVLVADTGLNLRYGPGTSTESMGKYYNGTLVRLLRRMPDAAGDSGWWRVQVGQMEGYMSEIYLSEPTTESIAATLQRAHLPVAQAKKDIELMAGMTARPCEYTKIKKGTLMHVLGINGPWLHVSVPQGEFSWMMDLEAPSGYVRATDVSQGATPYLAQQNQ